jgi:hypothetical protein
MSRQSVTQMVDLPKYLDRVDATSAADGHDGRQQRHRNEHQRGADERLRIRGADLVEQRAHDARQQQRAEHTAEESDAGQQPCLT